jgi:nitrogen fixation protein NifB
MLTPRQAVEYLKLMIEKRPEIAVVGIAGPGDPFATPELTLNTLSLVRREFPGMLLCVATNGMAIVPYVDDLGAVGVSHVTITVNAVDPGIGKDVYRWFRDGTKVLRGVSGAALLIDRQLEAIRRLKKHGIIVKVNSILLPGINDRHIEAVAKTVAENGADLFNCIPLLPAAGSDFENLEEPDGEFVGKVRSAAEQYLPQMVHCMRCRADAAGFLEETCSDETTTLLRECSTMESRKRKETAKRVAVASIEGLMVNQHLGNASVLSIYEAGDDGRPQFVEERPTPIPGSGEERWHNLAHLLHDCCTVLVRFAGTSPREILRQYDIEVVVMEGFIEEALQTIFSGSPLPSFMTATAPRKCGSGCSGDGGGCAV